MKIKLNTPCIGICSTVYGDNVCRGCKRFSPEIIDWNTMADNEKQAIFDRLGQQITDVCENYFIVQDADLLQIRLHELHIRYREEQPAITWAYHLLRCGAHKMKDINNYGISLHAGYEHLTLTELFSRIDNTVLQLAENLYQHQTALSD